MKRIFFFIAVFLTTVTGRSVAETANPFESKFYDADWQLETKSKIDYNAENGKVTVYINYYKDAQWKAQILYHGPAAQTGKYYHVGLKMKSNKAIPGVSLKWQDDNSDPTIIYEDKSIYLTANAEYVYDRPCVAGLDGNGILNVDFGFAQEGTIIEIYDIVIEELQDVSNMRKVTVTVPDCSSEIPAITGTFNGWNPTALPMSLVSGRTYTMTVQAEAFSEFKIAGAINGWKNEIQVYNTVKKVWENMSNMSFGEQTDITLDFSDSENTDGHSVPTSSRTKHTISRKTDASIIFFP